METKLFSPARSVRRAAFFALILLIGGSLPVPGADLPANLTLVRVWPNPYKPNSGNPLTGKPYRDSDPDSGVVIDNLPFNATIRIYDHAGAIVTEFPAGVKTGRFQWDVRNTRGRDVTSGVYYAAISAPGSKSITKRIMVIR